MNEPRSIHAAEDWGVVLQSVPSKNKKEIVKRLEEIFGLDKHDAEQILSNMPLILVDNISFGLAARIKKFFQTIGAVTETTNHDMIKKNCFQVLWPQTPDLSFFMKNETGPAEAFVQEKKINPVPSEAPSLEKKATGVEIKSQIPKIHEAFAPAQPAHESPAIVPKLPAVFAKPAPETPAVPHSLPIPAMPPQGAPEIFSQPHPVSEEKPGTASSSGVDSDWERRAHELNEKLRKITDEKKRLHEQHVEVTEKVKSDFQQKIEHEKQKSEEIAKAYEDLRVQAQKQEALTQEGDAWRSKAMALGEKVRELETNLMQKTSAIEHLIQQKDELSRQSEKAAELTARVVDLEKTIGTGDEERSALQTRVSDFEKNILDAQHELENYRNREQAGSQKAAGLEREVREMKESLQARDAALAQFEKQILELAEKVRGYDALRQEHGQLVQERATIRKEYDAKLVEQEVRLSKIEEEHRRHRSRVDRKNAAATRELGEWVRGVDTVRQGLQKLILFLGSESAVLDTEKKFPLKSPLTRGPESPNQGKS